jgi:hypothetical protein
MTLEVLQARDRELSVAIMELEITLSEKKAERVEVRRKIMDMVIKGQLPLPLDGQTG